LGKRPHLPTDPNIHQIAASEGPYTVSGIEFLDRSMLEVLEEDCAMSEP
jgi:hypothetical protein